MFKYVPPPGIQANAWITSATAINMIHKLLTDCTEHCKYNWIFIPHVNPDGYEYSRNNDSTWVKNRNELPDNCIGVSINHNFRTPGNEEHIGASFNCTDDNYYGGESLDKESTFLYQVQSSFSSLTTHFYISLNSYGEKILYPFARDKATNTSKLSTYEGLTDAYLSASSLQWSEGAYGTILGIQDGTSMDSCVANSCADYSFTLQLRNSANGGNPDSSEILDSTDETLLGIYAMMDYLEGI